MYQYKYYKYKNKYIEIKKSLEITTELKNDIINDVKYGGGYRKLKIDTRNIIKLRPPDFIIIGAQKCGTESAIINLNKHSQIFVNHEIHFFDSHWKRKTKNWYFTHFNVEKPIRGEKTPEYMYVDGCIEAMKDICPKSKYIIFLRDPVKRAFSHWNMNCMQGKETRSFSDCVAYNLANLNEPHKQRNAITQYVQRGFYAEQILNFMEVFPKKEQLLIIISDRKDITQNENYDMIFDFLNVEREVIDITIEHVRPHKIKIDSDVEKQLINIYEKHNMKLFDLLGYSIPEWK